MSRRAVATVVALVIAYAAPACGSGSARTEASVRASGGATTNAPAASTPLTADAAAAYRAAVAAYAAAADPPDPDAPALAALFTGDALLKARAALGRSRADGIASRGGSVVESASVTTQDVERATVVACVRDLQARYRMSNGTLVAAAPGTVAAVVVTMALVDGRWRVSAVAPGTGC